MLLSYPCSWTLVSVVKENARRQQPKIGRFAGRLDSVASKNNRIDNDCTPNHRNGVACLTKLMLLRCSEGRGPPTSTEKGAIILWSNFFGGNAFSFCWVYLFVPNTTTANHGTTDTRCTYLPALQLHRTLELAAARRARNRRRMLCEALGLISV